MSGAAAEGAPRGRMTAYAFFVQSCREKYERTHHRTPTNFTDFIRNCLSQWANMSELEKAPFQQLAAQDKERYDNEMRNHPNAGSLGKHVHGKKRKQTKNDQPKRPLAAFYWYCRDNRPLVMSEHPDYDSGEVAVALGRRWIDACSEIKDKYEAMAEKDQARYNLEMAAYKRKETSNNGSAEESE